MVCVTVTGENVTTGVTSTARLHLVDLAGYLFFFPIFINFFLM